MIPGNFWKVIQPAGQAPPPSDGDTVLSPEVYRRQLTAQRYTGRMAWFSLLQVYLLACLAALTVTCALLFQHFARARLRWLLGVLGLSALVGMLLYNNKQVHMAIFLAVFQHAIRPDMPHILDTMNFLNAVGNAATFTLLLTICALLLPEPPLPYPDGLNGLVHELRSMRAILYAGTVLLVVTMLLKSAIYQ